MRIGIKSILSSYLPPAKAQADLSGLSASPRSNGLHARRLLDETTLLLNDEIARLGARGTIFLTRCDDGRFGAIIADNLNLAMTRADIRDGKETVIGLMDAGFLPHLRASAKATVSCIDNTTPTTAPQRALS
ncbi:hypothetical protein [Hyphomicrobium sulfonivorans]|uniref:hypothetical protein n=1 Tax=Hyphomicrobium sulfonivorans TaxID=121290 RepID=UPI00156DF45C|nr:hypothetical protein [Hyphomicrobium sulfonivorans]MBI1648831.1 hypothetical protein [Hyphomicrobium sulfonivorans]NSL70634.1 hypothetical protein [Hyphomicrobium sulfonivorans]